MEVEMEPLGKKIQRLRDEKEWNQAMLAKRSGIMAATISRIEKGEIKNPGIKILKSLASALGVTIDYLVGLKDSVTFDDALKRDPDAQIVFRGYEKLKKEKREQVKRFVQFLQKNEEEE
jgi:transcriptional regulator with XRE-family HTH domain